MLRDPGNQGENLQARKGASEDTPQSLGALKINLSS